MFHTETSAKEYAVKNTCLGASSPFDVLWQVSPGGGLSHNLAPLTAGTSQTATDLLELTKGMHLVKFTIDHLNQVAASNENNNRFQFKVAVAGSCNGATPARTQAVTPRIPPASTRWLNTPDAAVRTAPPTR
jgi:hypothetical protein